MPSFDVPTFGVIYLTPRPHSSFLFRNSLPVRRYGNSTESICIDISTVLFEMLICFYRSIYRMVQEKVLILSHLLINFFEVLSINQYYI